MTIDVSAGLELYVVKISLHLFMMTILSHYFTFVRFIFTTYRMRVVIYCVDTPSFFFSPTNFLARVLVRTLN